MPLRNPLPASPAFAELLAAVELHADERLRVVLGGVVRDTAHFRLRLFPSRIVTQVRVHVQTPAAGGVWPYNSAAYAVRVDAPGVPGGGVDVSVARDGVTRHVAYFIPMLDDGQGGLIAFDGAVGRPDFMTFVDLGV